MVLLRLTVKVVPPPTGGQLQARTQEGATSFLMVLRNPEKITLQDLTFTIADTWKNIRPDVEYDHFIPPETCMQNKC